MPSDCVLPKLLINISPPKCGTTGLYAALSRTPGIAAPIIKEPRFFIDDETARFPDVPAALSVKGHFSEGERWFRSLFKATDLEKSTYALDFTTYYAVSDEAPSNVRSLYEQVRAIMVVRDPVERFVSHYWQYKKMGIALPPLADVIRGNAGVSALLYGFSNYRATYERWCQQFGSRSILLMHFDIIRNPSDLEAAISQFLDIDTFLYDPSGTDRNPAGLPRFHSIQSLVFSGGMKRVSGVLPPAWKPRLLRVRKALVRANTRNQSYPSLEEADRKILSERLSDARQFSEACR